MEKGWIIAIEIRDNNLGKFFFEKWKKTARLDPFCAFYEGRAGK